MKTRKQRMVFRKLRGRNKIFGTVERPRLSVYRSLKHIYAQVINDLEGRTLVAASSKDKGFQKASGIQSATQVGANLGKKALEKGIKTVVFDRGGRAYHGRVKALADGARQSGLEF